MEARLKAPSRSIRLVLILFNPRDGFQLFPPGVGCGQIPLHLDQPGANPHHFVASLLVNGGVGHNLIQAVLFGFQGLDLLGQRVDLQVAP